MKATRWAGALLATGLLATGLLTACGAGGGSARDNLLVPSVPKQVTIQTRTITGLGTILTDDTGRTLYMFALDLRTRVTCTGPCAGTWPAVAITTAAHPTAGSGVDPTELATVTDPNSGAHAVTYNGYPLYYYSGDTRPGTAHGQGLFLNGGPWYVLNPAGQPLTTEPTSKR